MAIDAVTARNALYSARSSLVDAQTALAEGDLPRARSRVESAASAATRAESRTTGPHWAIVRRAPFVGDDVRMARDITEVVDAAATVANEAMGVADQVLTDEGGLPDLTVEGRIDIAPIRTMSRGLAELDLEPLRSTSRQLEASTDRPWLATITAAREETLAAADAALSLMERGQDATAIVTALLGADEPSRYLVMVQNNGELRGTGGLIGFLAVLDVADGQLELSDPEGVNPEAVLAGSDLVVRGRFQEQEFRDEPVDRPADFAARYDHIAAGSFLASTNADPDLPTVAPLVLDLYEQRTTQRLDGLITIDPLALQRMQQAVGPLELPDRVRRLAPELPHPLPADQLASVLLIDVYDVLGGPTDERRLYQSAVAEASLRSLLGGAWEATGVAEAIVDAAGGRHLQVYSRDDQTQEAILRLGVGGALTVLEADDDLLAVSANNVAGNKIDVHVAHRIGATITLAEPRVVGEEFRVRREVTRRIEVHNGVDVDAHDSYIVTSLLPARLDSQIERDPRLGLARTWVTHWLPGDAQLRATRDADGQPVTFNTDQIHGLLAVDHYLEVPAGSSAAFEVTSVATVPTRWDGSTLTYGLTIWSQGKGIPDQLDVAVEPPAGWQVIGAVFTGGGQPGGLGPGAPGTSLEAAVEDGIARLRGSATADTRLVVRLAPTRT